MKKHFLLTMMALLILLASCASSEPAKSDDGTNTEPSVTPLLVTNTPENAKVLNFSSNAVRYEYDSDNLLGLKATVVDGRNYTYVFDGDLCIFNEYDVMKANQKNEIVSAFRNIPNFTPESVYFNRKSGDIYLTLCFGDDVDMDRVDGFYLYLSDTEWITVNQPKDITSVDHYEITDHNFDNAGYESWFGHDWTQVWNKDECGTWSELRDRHYSNSTMPLE